MDPSNHLNLAERRANRAAHMVAMRQQGHTLEEIGSAFGVSRERARQIINRHGGLGVKGRSTSLDPLAVLRFARSRDVTSLEEVAEHFDVHQVSITRLLHALGVHKAITRLYRIRTRKGAGYQMARVRAFIEREGRFPTMAEFGLVPGSQKHPDLPAASGLMRHFGSMKAFWEALGMGKPPRGQGNKGHRITHCKRGHEMVGDNVFSYPSRPENRYCRACRAIREGRKAS